MSTTHPERENAALRNSIGATGSPLPQAGGGTLPESFGRYRVERLLGRGAMGAVYLARDTQLSRQVALKVPNFKGDDSDEVLERFYREARLAATLRNPYLCPVYDVGEIQGVHYISMAYIEGRSLAELIKASGPQKERASLLLVRKLAIALQEAHSAGIIHRDLKPANVMIDVRGEPVVMDFGLALRSEDVSRITHSGAVLGSPAYMSPEQLEGPSRELTPASDQFALGVLLYELLTGELPFRGTVSAVAHQIVNGAPPSPRTLRSDLDPRTETFCLKLMGKTPDDRFRSMKEVAEHVAQLVKKGPVAEPASAPPAAEPARGVEQSPPAEHAPENSAFRKQVEKLLSWGELVSALETLENPGSKLSGPLADWARQKRVEVREQIERWKKELPAQLKLGRELIAKHDYREAATMLALVPVGVRTSEFSAALQEAQEQADEVDQLFKDIELVFRTGTDDELKWLVKRFLQLKPGHQKMKRLAEDLKRFGSEQVIRQRRGQRNFLDPAGRIWEPKSLALYGVGLAAACGLLYAATVLFQAPVGHVAINVLDPAIAIDFADARVSQAESGQSFRLPVGKKQMLAVRVGDVLIAEATRELSVERNETKRVTAKLVDGQVELTIDSEKKVFQAKGERDSTGRLVAAVSGAGPPAATDAEPWIDILETVDMAKASDILKSWKHIDGVLTGTVVPPAKEAWTGLSPDLEFRGDYDFEMEFTVNGATYMQVGVPLNGSNAILSLSDGGCGWSWIDGKDFNLLIDTPPYCVRGTAIREGVRHRVAISFRDRGSELTVKATLDGQPAGEYSGPHSRLVPPAAAKINPGHFRTVAKIIRPEAPGKFEVHQMRVKRMSTTPAGPPPAIAAPPAAVDLLKFVSDAKGDFENGVFSLRLPEEKQSAWAIVIPDYEFDGDYDLEVDYSIQGAGYVGIGIPLNETNVNFSMSNEGSGFNWIDGRDFPFGNVERPHGEPTVSIVPGKVRRVGLSVRHSGANVTVKATVDGRPAGEFSGLRSRLSIPQQSAPARRKLKMISHLDQPNSGARLAIQRAELRKVAATPGPQSAVPEKFAPRGELIIDGDFRTSVNGFNLADQDWILEEWKDREFRYLGKLHGYYHSPFNWALHAPENDRIRDFEVEFDIRFANPNKGEFVLEFGRYGDWRYKLCMAQDGMIYVRHLGDAELTPPTKSPALKPMDQFNAIRMNVENRRIRLAVNGVQLFDVEAEHYSAAKLQPWLWVAEPPFDVRLQRFRVDRISAAPVVKTDPSTRQLKGHTGVIRDVAFLPDSVRAVSVSEDRTMKLWDITTGELLFDFPGHAAAVTSVSISADGKRALTGCDDTFVRLWDLENRTLLKTLKGHTAGITSVVINRNGTTAYSGGWDNTIRKWDLRGNSRPTVLPGPDGESHLIFSPDESLVACSARDGSVALRGLKAAGALTGHDLGPIRGLAFTPDGSKLVAGGYGSTVRVWDVATGRQIHRFESGDAGFDSVAVTSSGRYAIGGCSDHTLRVWNLETGDEIIKLTANAPVTHRLALSPDDRWILSGGGNAGPVAKGDYDLRLWKLPSPPAP